jgi:hypothetical protein
LNPDAIPAATWFELLFKGYRDGIPSDPVDCSGEPITWTALPDGCVELEPTGDEVLPRKAVAPNDLIVRHAGGEYWFGWAPYRRFTNGMAEGPVAIARNNDGTFEARALGTLRSYTDRARLEVRKLGDQHVLTAEGERCAAPGDCQRATRIMWLERQHFRVRPVRSATVRNCLGPAWFPNTETIKKPISQRWERAFQRNLALAFEGDHIVIDEHVLVNDRDVEQPSLPPKLFREAQAQLKITIDAGELLSEGQSLWRAIRTEDGSTEAVAPAAPAAQ